MFLKHMSHKVIMTIFFSFDQQDSIVKKKTIQIP
jgi:hypothetical protein